MILRVKFTKKNYLRYISHLDLIRLFQRTFNRANIPVSYSEGFNPHPKFSIANPLSLGVESEEEYMDIDLVEEIDIEKFIEDMNKVLPQDVQIIAGEYPKDVKPVNFIVDWALYEINFDLLKEIDLDTFKEKIDQWLKNDQIMIERLRKQGRRKVMREEDIKAFIKELEVVNLEDNIVTLKALLKSGDNGNLRPLDFIGAMDRDNNFGIDMDSIMLKRLGLFAQGEGHIYKPL